MMPFRNIAKVRLFLVHNLRIIIVAIILVITGLLLIFINKSTVHAASLTINIPELGIRCGSNVNVPGHPCYGLNPLAATGNSGAWPGMDTSGDKFWDVWSFTVSGNGGIIYDCTATCVNHGRVWPPPGQTTVSGDGILSGSYGGGSTQRINITCKPQGFQPGVKSQMKTTVSDLTNGPAVITDTFTSTQPTPTWSAFPGPPTVNFATYLLGPFATKMANGGGTWTPGEAIATGTPVIGTSPLWFNGSGQSKDVIFSGINRGGYFYGVAQITAPVSTFVLNKSWQTPKFDTTELTTVKFQPFVKSKVSATGTKGEYQTGGVDYFTADPGDTITDEITSRAATSLANANSGTAGNDNIWPNGMLLKVCVDLYGPYQKPQDNNLVSAPTGTLVSSQPRATKCTGDVATSGAPTHFSAAGQTKPFEFVAPSEPGYYYFMERIVQSDQPINPSVNRNDTSSLIINNWTSKFNPSDQIERFIVRFQPITESQMVGNRDPQNSENNSVIFDCVENKQKVDYQNSTPIHDPALDKNLTLDELPPAKLTCNNVTDKIYIGATDKRDISGDNVNRQHVSESSWLKDVDGNYELVKFRVKLYGPFATPESRSPAAPAVGKTIQTVPYQPVGTGTPSFTSAYPQPAAMTELINADNGPKWDLLNNPTDEHYEAVFMQDAIGGTSGVLTTTSLKLAPGFYVSVVEILRDDNGPISTTGNVTSASGNLMTGNSDNGNRIFYSAWGDSHESISIPLPVYAWSKRNILSEEVAVGTTVNDSIWITGFDPAEWVVPRPGQPQQWIPLKDAIGNNMITHGAANFDGKGNNWVGYPGTPGYFAADALKDIVVTLYGPYPNVPSNDTRQTYCQVYDPSDGNDKIAKKVVGIWKLSSQDYNSNSGWSNGITLPEGGYKVTAPGWYVFYIEYAGSDRVYPFSSSCADPNEMFHAIGDVQPNDPILSTQINPSDDSKPIAPIVVTDNVIITDADPEEDSIIQLTLFKQTGSEKDITTDIELCKVSFTVSTTDLFTTADYIESDGTVKSGHGSGRCFAPDGGHYYWYEEFKRPDESYYPNSPNVGGDGEEVTITNPKPEITTKAQPDALVGEPFGDTAIVSGLTAGKKYKIIVKAYGPQTADGSAPVCEEAFFTWEKEITTNGSYDTDKTKVDKSGNVYWIEYLYEDKDNNGTFDENELVDSGKCGIPNETTRIKPFIPPPPDSGAFVRNVVIVIAFGAVIAVAVWLLTKRNEGLFNETKK